MAILHFRCKERRRTVRVNLSIPLKVHGISSEGETFAVETTTHTISLHGASVELEHPVQLGDILTVENELTRQQGKHPILIAERFDARRIFATRKFFTQHARAELPDLVLVQIAHVVANELR